MRKNIVVYTNGCCFSIGGGSSHRLNIIENIHKFHYVLLCNKCENKHTSLMYKSNIEIIQFPRWIIPRSLSFPRKRIISYPARLINDFQTLYSKFSFLKNKNFNLLHAHGVAFYTAILQLNRLLKKNIYQKIVDFSFVKEPKLLTLHNFFPGFTKDTITVDAYNHYIDQFDNIICVDKHIYDYCSEYCEKRGYDKRIWFIPNSIDTKRFFYAPSRETGKFKVGFVGRLAGTVDLGMINQLLSRLPKEMVFYVAVTGDLSLIKVPKNIENRVNIFEDIPQFNMPKFYHSIDVLFNPILHKGITRVTLEAMACGRTVIMYKIGNKYPLIDGKTGYLADRDLDVIIKVLISIHNNPGILEQVGLNARKIVEEKFCNEAVIPKIKKIYNYLIE